MLFKKLKNIEFSHYLLFIISACWIVLSDEFAFGKPNHLRVTIRAIQKTETRNPTPENIPESLTSPQENLLNQKNQNSSQLNTTHKESTTRNLFPEFQIKTSKDFNQEIHSEPTVPLALKDNTITNAAQIPLPGIKKDRVRTNRLNLIPEFDVKDILKTDYIHDKNKEHSLHNHQISFGADGEIIQVQGCSSCSKGFGGSNFGNSGTGSHLSLGPATCGPDGCNGRQPCYPWEKNKTFLGRFAGAIYESLVCPDPCYEGKWIPLADSAFFSDSIRPVSQQKLRWDRGWNMTNPTRNAYFFNAFPLSPPPPVNSLDYNDVFLYTEIASGGFSVISDISYRQLSIDPSGGGSGFGDMMVGTKSLLFDRELLQIAFEFKTFLPVGNFNSGLGTGHVSLEPTILACLKLKEKTYLQGQISEWIPLGATTPPIGTAGSLMHLHLSLNHVLHEINPDMPIIGTLEYTGYYFQAGGNQNLSVPAGTFTQGSPNYNPNYFNPVNGNPSPAFSYSSGISYQYLGPGLRLFVGNNYDIGIGSQIALSGSNRFADALMRVECRFRY